MKLACLFAFLLLHLPCFAKPIKVTFIVPDSDNTRFWNMVTQITKSVADDLEVELTVRLSGTNRFSTLAAVQATIKETPDYIIYRPFQGNGVEVFDLIESNKIHFVTLEQGLNEAERLAVGPPQQKYQYWLDSVVYDDEAGGALLAAALLKEFQLNQPNQTMHLTGIGGGFDQISLNRQASLLAQMRKSDNMVINQIFPMSWSVETLSQQFEKVYQRYPQTNAFWCVSDDLALTVLQQLSLLSPPNIKPIYIGGFDWIPAMLDKIKSGEVTASVGGHFLMTAKALIKVVDHHHNNQQFEPANSLEKFELIDQNNVSQMHAFIEKAPWPEIDYRQFSKSHSSQPPKLTVSKLLSIYSQLKTGNE